MTKLGIRSAVVMAALVVALPATGLGQNSSEATSSEATRPNIIFIMADDHTSQAWGCYDSRLADYCPTPHIDRLAEEGARLTNCFCTNSICVPSRASILTGQYSHRNGVKTLRGSLDPENASRIKGLKQNLARLQAELGDQP